MTPPAESDESNRPVITPDVRPDTARPARLRPKRRRRLAERPPHIDLSRPVVGMEAEFNVLLDEVEINPEEFWKHPSAFIEDPMIARTGKSSQLPTGGAVYFDRGVIEVVTPVIEIEPGCSARVVRNLWEQIGYVRDQLTRWSEEHGRQVRLRAYSAHYNISFELPRRQRNRHRNIQKLALLLAYILPVPVMLIASNRRSTGVGVRPRKDRIEITVDFTPDPGLTIATAALLVGIIREVISWPSYELTLLDELPIPTIAGVVPGKHTTRKGWLTKDFHYPQSPYTSDIDEKIWRTRSGEMMSLREIGFKVACFFKASIRRHSDTFSFRLLFAILRGLAPSLLELKDRPLAYDDVGRLCRWGMVIHELEHFRKEERAPALGDVGWQSDTIEDHIAVRDRERVRERAKLPTGTVMAQRQVFYGTKRPGIARIARGLAANRAGRRASDLRVASGNGRSRARRQSLIPSRASNDSMMRRRQGDYIDRRAVKQPVSRDRRRNNERRTRNFAIPFNDRRLTRSAYELVFLKLVSGGKLKEQGELWRPVGMKGWFHAIFRREADGAEKLLTIDQLLKRMDDWV
jgi:hypothetical protein